MGMHGSVGRMLEPNLIHNKARNEGICVVHSLATATTATFYCQYLFLPIPFFANTFYCRYLLLPRPFIAYTFYCRCLFSGHHPFKRHRGQSLMGRDQLGVRVGETCDWNDRRRVTRYSEGGGVQ